MIRFRLHFKERALLYAQSEITDTLRQARWAEADSAAAEFGIKLAMLWTSALIPTTRKTHAERHGKTFTTKQVREFYGRDGNVFNCRCSQVEVMLDDKGRPILPRGVQSKTTDVRERWLKAYGGN